MPKLVDPVRQRGEIRSAARRVFSRRGIAGTGLTHVAAAAGMGRSSLYHYYPDKASLMRDLLREVMSEEEAFFAAAVQSEGTPLERAERLAGILAGMFEQWTAVGRMLFDLRLRETRGFRPFFRRIRNHVASLIAEGQRLGEMDPRLDPSLGAATLIGTVDGLLLQHLVDPRAFSDPQGLENALVLAVRKLLQP
jgi:AcrR family transcriptional regulator